MKKKVLCVIPARKGSKGLKNKNIKKLNKIPLIAWSILTAKKCELIDEIIVSTDSLKISKIAKKYGANVPFIRPKKLATDTTSLEPVIEHVLNYLNIHDGYNPEIIVILQNTSPLRTTKHIDEALTLMKKQNYDSILSGFSIHTFLWKQSKKVIIPLDYDPKKRPNRQSMHEQLFENGAIFATKTSCFIKSNCRISGKIGFYKMPIESSYNIDSYDDLRSIKKFFKILNHN